jgi:2-iminobutanoate/2-iminopropanoate deaminase
VRRSTGRPEEVNLKKEKVESREAPAAIGPYSQAIKLNESLVFVSGQLGLDPATGLFAGQTAEAQAERALKNLFAVLEAAGLSKAAIVKTTVFLKDMDDFARVNEVYARMMEPPFPARSCVGGLGLPKGGLVEIEAIAAVG